MKRIVIILAGVALLIGGCPAKPKAIYQANNEPGYVQGFIDGYLSAFPGKPYRREHWSAHPTCSGGAYDQGWRSGRRIGKKDERQRP